MAKFFIRRPIFAWVIAIVIMLGGVLAISTLSISQYPEIAPTTVRISATYNGASAETVEKSVTSIIEDGMTGLDDLTYMTSSSSTGRASVTLTFGNSVEPDIAQVQVQNKLQLVQSQLPDVVQSAGLSVTRSTSSILLVGALVSTDGARMPVVLGDIFSSQIEDQIKRLEGVGSIEVFGTGYAMRVWLDPFKLNKFQLTPNDVTNAIQAQNTQVSVGSLGSQPVAAGQQLNVTVTAQSQLRSVSDFESIILKVETDGATVRLSDVARIEIGQESYTTNTRANRKPATGFAVNLATGANALDTADRVKTALAAIAPTLPENVIITYPYDTSPFVKLSIEKVVHTLIEAIVLVFFVLLIFLQNLRATIIPMIAVPVVLLGTFGILALTGYSINTLTMFAMVLAIGLLVDDAIVVVENVERIMEDEGLEPREATRKSMGQITGALIGIALVLSAVFVPMAFFGGSTGVIYKQFAVTIASAMGLSVVVALSLTPALCATLLRNEHGHKTRGLFGLFNRGFDSTMRGYGGAVGWIIRRPLRMMLIYAAIGAAMVFLFLRTPTGFLPDEDQGIMFALIQGPTGATQERTDAVIDQIQHYFAENESENVDSFFGVSGFSFAGSGQNMGIAFLRLKDWDERPGADQSVQAIAGRAFPAFMGIRDAMAFPIVPPSVIELGNVSGFDFYLQARAGQPHEQLLDARNQLLGMAAQDGRIAQARPNGLEDASEYKLDIDWRKAGAMGVTASDVGSLLSVAWAGSYVNDFIDRGRIKRVYVQGESQSRAVPTDIDKWRVRNSAGGLVPFSNFAEGRWSYGPQGLSRYNGVPAMNIQGNPAPGVSSGQGMAAIEELAAQLPPGFDVAWTGLSLEEQAAGNQTMLLYGLSLAVVFLCLAALYESWSIPFAVMLAMPIGVLGALVGAWLGGFDNGVFFQVGLLTVIGLTGKNAILIVEFAREQVEQHGKPLFEAVIEAARQRFRPIMMTSVAFSLGVLPLVLSTGAGANGRNTIGATVLGGTVSATVLGVLFVPLFFVLVRRALGRPEAPEPGAART